MNIVNKLTWRHMMKNKRRTLVTIIGVIISVAMVTAVFTLFTSFMDLLQRQTMERTGKWHVTYENVNAEQLEAIRSDDQTQTSFLSRDIGYAVLQDSKNDQKPYVYLMEFDEQGFQNAPVKLLEGRLPQNEHEVLLSAHIESSGQVVYEIGDEITWEFGQRVMKGQDSSIEYLDQTYSLIEEGDGVQEELLPTETRSLTVVGIIEPPYFEPSWSPGYTIISYLDEATVADRPVDVFVFAKKVNFSFKKKTEQFASSSEIDSYRLNDELLRYYGIINNQGTFRALLSFITVIMLIIMVGSVSLIYNAFAISVSERSRHLGMLSSVGATKKQKRRSVLFEGAVITLISIPIGIISGILGIAVTFYFINDRLMRLFDFEQQLTVAVTPLTIILSCLISIMTIYISTYIPARRASKVSAIDAIRQSMDYKMTRKTVKTSRLVRWIFGFEAEIGLKNLKRQKKRYLATIFSLMISIVLFLTVTFFTSSIERVNQVTQDGYNYDMRVTFEASELTDDQRQTIVEIEQLPSVTQTNLIKESYIFMRMDMDYLPDVVQENLYIENNVYEMYGIYFKVLPDEDLIAYAKEIGVSSEYLMRSDRMTAIIPNELNYYDVNREAYVQSPALMVEAGDVLQLENYNFEKDAYEDIGELEIVATTDVFPIGVVPLSQSSVNVIVSESTFNQIKEKEIRPAYYTLYIESSDPLKTEEVILKTIDESAQVFNIYKLHQEDKEISFIISVFTFGFIALITLISIANIFNTISTSISLRKREFGMLKSVGMTPKGFNKMIRYESLFYGIKALLYGLPISIGLMYLMHRSLAQGFYFKFQLPWMYIFIVIVAVFIIVSMTMMYATAKVKKENIIDALKQENI